MTVAWPTVRARLASQLPAVVGAGATVYDGPVVTGDAPSAYVTVAHQPSVDTDSAGDYSQDRTSFGGYVAEERGSILLEVAAVSGDPAVPDAFTIAAAVHDWVQADQTLGVLSADATCVLGTTVLQSQNAAGAVQRLLLTLTYTTLVRP